MCSSQTFRRASSPPAPRRRCCPHFPNDTDAEAEIESELAEEERLFFVALTRARDYLVLSRAQKYGRMSAKVSPLLAAVENAAEWGREVWVGLPAESLPPSATGLSLASEGLSHIPVVEGGSDSEPTPAADLDLYLRCPRRYYYRRILALPEGDRIPYAGFKRAVTEALTTPDPDAALNAAWGTYGPEPAHPHASLYRQAADEIVARGARLPVAVETPTLAFPLENGVVTVQPDAVVGGGEVFENRTFRKPPADETGANEAAPDRRLSLLQAAAETSGRANAPKIQLRYLQTGAVRPVADKPKVRAKHLMEYDRALRGIQLQMFPPTPDEAGGCAVCPYFFICPG